MPRERQCMRSANATAATRDDDDAILTQTIHAFSWFLNQLVAEPDRAIVSEMA
jgi:hypothetical protein